MLSFKLSEDFVSLYENKTPPFGFEDAGGNSLGELTFVRTYSRVKEDGTKERWHEVCQRVIEGMYSIQKDHAAKNKLPWNSNKAQTSAKEAYDRLFHLKWTPPGRGIHQMGTPNVMTGNSASLQNCAVVSTGDINRYDPGYVFQWGMEALMNGVGLGFDTIGEAMSIVVDAPYLEPEVFVIPDTREGWADSVRVLINSYLRKKHVVEFDYSLIRPEGTPLKTFGGVASGPKPLIELHDKLRNMFKSRQGEILDSRAITDIFNMIAGCVVAGNVRRSAELAMGEYGDDTFLNLKNRSEFPERNSHDPENPGWAWASNNSINVPIGADYEQYIDRIVDNGEPGFIWMDVARSRGRMKDSPDAKDSRVAGFNPCCVAPSTSIMTSNGPRKISEINEEFVAIVDGKSYPASKPWVSGIGDVYRLSTKEGFALDLTPEHRIMTADGDWVEAQDLLVGDKIRLHSHGDVQWGNTDNYGDGYLIGHFVGDGDFSNQNKVSQRDRGAIKKGMPVYVAHMKVWDIAGDDKDIADYSQKIASEYATRSDWGGWSNVSDRPYSQMSITGVTKKYGIKIGSKHDIGHLEAESSEFYKGFLRGLFDADGHVEGYEEGDSYKGLSIRLGQSNKSLLESVQRMLLRLGINSKIYKARDAGETLLPDGRGGKALYHTKASWRLVVSADSAIKFADQIGFLHVTKSEKLAHALSWRKRAYTKPFVATVESFEFLGRQEVWDAEVSTVHSFDANGIYAHNSEQPLESFEMCTLTTIHLQNAESKEDFLRTLKFAFLYAKTVTLMPTNWIETNSVMQRNRRIGLSLTGITDVLDSMGMPYITDLMESGYDEVRKWDGIYSEWLCIRESNRVTTLKPEGTVSLLSGASPGIHWGPGGRFYLRAIRFSDTDPMINLFRNAGYVVEPDLVSKNTQVVYFPVQSNSHRTEKQVSMFEKIGLAAKAQEHWSDNGVSVTVSFDKEKERDYLVPALRLHEGRLKSVSFLPMGNDVYPQQPYTSITEEEYLSYQDRLFKIDWSEIYDGKSAENAIGEKFCSTDTCTI